MALRASWQRIYCLNRSWKIHRVHLGHELPGAILVLAGARGSVRRRDREGATIVECAVFMERCTQPEYTLVEGPRFPAVFL